MRPDAGSFAEDIYAQLEQFQYDEERTDYALLKFLDSMGQMFQEVEDYARDTDDGEIGYSILVDLIRAPTAGLRWLGQFVGVSIPEGLSDESMRALIAARSQRERGTVNYIVARVQTLLTGGKNVIVHERTTSAYTYSVYTYAVETPDEVAVLAELTASKPAGLIMTYDCVSGNTYAMIVAQYATYDEVLATFTSYDNLLLNI